MTFFLRRLPGAMALAAGLFVLSACQPRSDHSEPNAAVPPTTSPAALDQPMAPMPGAVPIQQSQPPAAVDPQELARSAKAVRER